MADPSPQRGAVKRKKKRPPTFVDVYYPFWLGVMSFAWALVGWVMAAAAPHLAFAPLVGALHYVLPAVTIGLILANLLFALRNLWRGAHPLRLLLVTGLQVLLFTTLFYQLFAHAGAELFDVEGATYPWQWVGFSLAHALRASDVLDVIEAFGMKVQPIKHQSALVAVFVVGYHVVVDVFVLGVLWALVARVKRRFLDDEVMFDLTRKVLSAAFVLWLLVWVACAFVIYRWSLIDIPLWLVENVLRVVDFADVMESFNLRLHDLPREGVTGTLTTLCRFWIAVGIALVLGEKKKARERRLATPPEVSPFPYWARRVGALAGMVLAVLSAGLLAHVALGNPAPRLAAAVAESSEDQARAALRALRRMGPAAADAVPALVAARAKSTPIADDVTRTLGYLGTSAIEPLTQIALAEEGTPAAVAAESLRQIGPESAPALARIWGEAASEPAKEQAAEELRRLGSAGVHYLMEATTSQNAEAHYRWITELDRNWRLRGTSSPVARALQDLPDHLRRLNARPGPSETAEVLQGLARCGSAAREAMPALIPLLNAKDATVQAEAQSVVRSIGPRVTPELLKHLSGKEGAANNGIRLTLADARMWDEAALRDEAALPFLMSLLKPPTNGAVRDVALRALGQAGPRARAMVPVLVGLLGDPSPDNRQSVRETLARVDPGWKKHPEINRAIPALLPHLTGLPREEADELFAALGEVRAEQGEELARVLLSAPARPGAGLDRETRERTNKAYQDAVFAALHRLGPRAQAALPALTGVFSSSDLGDKESRQRLFRSLKHLTPDVREILPTAMKYLVYGDEAVAFLKEAGPGVAVPFLAEMLEDKSVDHRAFAIEVLAEFGPAARPALPGLLKRLGDPDIAWRVLGQSYVGRDRVLRTLEAIDKDWAKDPGAAKAFAAIVVLLKDQYASARKRNLQVIANAGAAARPVVLDLVKLMAGSEKDFAAEVRRALDRIDARWREDAEVKGLIPELVKQMLGPQPSSCWPLLAIGEGAVPELEKALAAGDAKVEAHIIRVLKEMGRPARRAVPVLAKRLAAPELTWETAPYLLRTLKEFDPEWTSHPRVKEAMPGLLADILAQPKTGARRYVQLCGVFGEAALPEVMKHLKKAKPGQRAAVVEALAQVGKGKKDLVGDLAPLLLDLDRDVRYQAWGALRAMDPDWTKSPKFAPAHKQLLKAFTDADAAVRFAALDALRYTGAVEGVMPALENMVKEEKDKLNKEVAKQMLDAFRRQM